MVEIHGWLTIFATYLDEDIHSEIDEDKIRMEVEQILKNAKYNHIEIKEINCLDSIDFSFYDNRKTEKTEELISIFENIAKLATGSYGVLYYWDDENPKYYNTFQVLVAHKGKCEWVEDKLLSPCDLLFKNE